MCERVCSRCVHLYVTEALGSPPRRCPRCQAPLRVVCRETFAHLHPTQGCLPGPVATSARSRFRAILRTRTGAPWLPPVALETLSTALVSALDRAARGHRDTGYAGLVDDLRAAEARDGRAPWGAVLALCCREVLDLYAGRFPVFPHAELPREASPVPWQPQLLAEPPWALMSLLDEAVIAGWTS